MIAAFALLFLGNSFTYFNQGVPYHLCRIAKADGQACEYEMTTISSASLHDLESVALRIGVGKWDVVVLQGQSREPIDPEQARGFRESARILDRAVRSHGARTALYMTWAFRDKPEMTELLMKAYVAIATELGAQVAPVGLAFARSRKENPAIELNYVDGFHPSLEGTYLAACVFYAALFHRSPEGNAYVAAGVAADIARKLQKTAWNVVRDFEATQRP